MVVENFRNFENLVIDPFPSNAVIVGENGCGKTNLLEAMRLVLDPSLGRAARALKESDICIKTLSSTELHRIKIKVEIELQGFDDIDAALSEFDGWIVSKEPLIARITYIWQFGGEVDESGDVDDEPHTRDFEWSIFGGTDELRDAARASRELPLTVVPALRDAARDLESWRTSPLASIIEMRPPSTVLVNRALERISHITKKLAADVELQSTATALKDRLSDMSGRQSAINPTIGFAGNSAAQLVRSLRLYIDSNRTRTVSETSTGGANVVYLALLLHRLNLQIDDNEQIDFILGVEEPEAHLHPTLQRQLFGFLLEHYSKLILTTHSPHIASVAELHSLILLRNDTGENTTVARTVANADLTTSEMRDLGRYMDVSRAEVLFAKAVILVEGIADLYFIRSLAKLHSFDLDVWGVVILNVQGTDFGPYRRLLGKGGFDIPHVIVTDGDSTTGDKWLGFSRAAGLLGDTSVAFQTVSERLISLRADGGDACPEDLYDIATQSNIFVGTHTLEVDICVSFGQEMAASIAALLSPAATTDPYARVSEVVRSNTEDSRASLLAAVSNVSKGRLGQRLADEVCSVEVSHPYFAYSQSDLRDDPIRYLVDALKRVASYVQFDWAQDDD